MVKRLLRSVIGSKLFPPTHLIKNKTNRDLVSRAIAIG